MAAEARRSRNPAGHAGLFNTLLALINSFAEFIASRSALFAAESKAALAQLIVVAACLVAAVIFFALGYLFLVGSAVVAIAHLAQVSWIWVALAAAGLHFVLAIVCLIVARSRLIPPYPELTAELKKDHEWLKNLDQNTRLT
jgi:cell division protein FtsW (lipid II flippase)